MTANSIPYDWALEIKAELKARDTTPLLGQFPPFPLEELALQLSQTFKREIHFDLKNPQWRAKEELSDQLGDTPRPLTFLITPLQGSLCWVMSEQQITLLASLLISENLSLPAFQDTEFIESFYRFLTLEVLDHFKRISFIPSLSVMIANHHALPEQECLSFDLAITIGKETLWGRVLISDPLRQSFVKHFAKENKSNQRLAEKIPLPIHLEVGRTSLSLQEWSQVKPGDFILLDYCSLHSQNLTGPVMLTLHNKNLFIGRIKEGKVKIIERALYHEVNRSMSPNHNDEEFEEESILPDEDEDLDADIDIDEGEFEDTGFAPYAEEISQPAESKSKTASQKRKPMEPNQIPISLTVEVARIEMPLQKLLSLEPGNILELNVHPEEGVDLTINGKLVGKGELIRIGETLGVRILEL